MDLSFPLLTEFFYFTFILSLSKKSSIDHDVTHTIVHYIYLLCTLYLGF